MSNYKRKKSLIYSSFYVFRLTFSVNFVIIKNSSNVGTPFQHGKTHFIIGNCLGGTKMNVFIDNLKNHRKSVSLESIFGKDSLKLYKTCEAIWLGWLHPYKGCYEANVPTILDFNFKANIPFNSSFDAE